MTTHTFTHDDATVVSTGSDYERLQKTAASLVIVQGNDIGKHFPIRRNSISIGRSTDADIILKDKRTSRIHAKIDTVYKADRNLKLFYLVDLGSTNHVHVNGKKIQDYLLENGDKIQIGDTILKFELQDEIDSRFHADIQRKIKYDDLTGLLTYESFTAALNWELETARSDHKSISLLMMDLDNFKNVNDTYGHLAGSYVLQEVGKLIKQATRQFDISARYGGEEFVTFMPETARYEAFYPAERLRRAIADHRFTHEGTDIRVTISIGISEFPDHGSTLDSIVQKADALLYQAKQDGKNLVYVAD